MTVRTPFQAAMRAAAVGLAKDYAAAAGLALNTYEGRPRTISPPHAFVDRIRERVTYYGPSLRQRIPTVDLIVVHGIFDSKDTTAQRDAFVDGFMDYATDNPHTAGPNTTLAVVALEDDPNWQPDWLPPDRQQMYYATTISIEGLSWE